MKDSFILYTDQKAVIDKLTDEQAGKLIKAIYHYAEKDEMPELDTLLDLVITPFKTAIDKNNDKWEEKKQRRSEAGKKGMSNRWNNEGEEFITNYNNDNNVINDITKITNDNNVIDVITNDNKNNNVIDDITKITNVTVNVNDNVSVSGNVNNINNIPPSDDGELRKHFELTWEKYPRKEGKTKALEYYLQWIKGRKISNTFIRLTDKQMYFAVRKYAEKCEKERN